VDASIALSYVAFDDIDTHSVEVGIITEEIYDVRPNTTTDV
jgi:hypothetical protein